MKANWSNHMSERHIFSSRLLGGLLSSLVHVYLIPRGVNPLSSPLLSSLPCLEPPYFSLTDWLTGWQSNSHSCPAFHQSRMNRNNNYQVFTNLCEIFKEGPTDELQTEYEGGKLERKEEIFLTSFECLLLFFFSSFSWWSDHS